MSPPPQSFADPAADPARLRLVAEARQAWRNRLVDPSRRNNLLYFRHLQRGTLDLARVLPERLAPILTGGASGAQDAAPTVDVRDLFDRDDLPKVTARLKEITRRAVENKEERGLETLHVVVGLATWSSRDDGREPCAPVLLVPIQLESSGREGRTHRIRRSGDPVPNMVLLYALATQFAVHLSSDDLFDSAEDADFDVEPIFRQVEAAAAGIEGFTIQRTFAIGNFAFQKLAMVAELDQLGDKLAEHPMIAAIAGHQPSRESLRGDRQPVVGDDLDGTSPNDEFLVLDADSSQQRAVRMVCSGRSGIISGPPGTGKSQTIANLVAELAARGKRVLFVAEKRAALEVVKDRLGRLQLDYLCLDLHGAGVKRSEVALRVREALNQVRQTGRVDPAECHAAFEARRSRVNEHVRLLHQRHAPANKSVFELQGLILAAPPEARSRHRWRRGRGLENLDAPTVSTAEDKVRELAGFGTLFTDGGASPWAAADFATGADAERAVGAAEQLLDDLWPYTLDTLHRLTRDLGLSARPSTRAIGEALDLLVGVSARLLTYRETMFAEPLSRLAAALSPASSFWRHAWAKLTSSEYRAAANRVKGYRLDRRVRAAQLLAEVRDAEALQTAWRDLSLEGHPRAWPGAKEARDRLRSCRQHLETLKAALKRPLVLDEAVEDLGPWLESLLQDATSAMRVARMRAVERALSGLVGGEFLHKLRTGAVEPSFWSLAFRYAWCHSCLDAIHADNPAMASFDGRTHEQLVEEFRQLDRQRIELAVTRVRGLHAERFVTTCNRFSRQEFLVRAEAAKKRKHRPVRDLVAEAPDVLTSLFPCWLASPLSVSQLLPAGELFDVVLFDEASQVLPEDAVPALYRASQAVVAGDRQQLPPTSFFAAQSDESDEADSVSGFESILDQMSTFLAPEWSLDWHYRSRDEALIAFSNNHIYANRLVTFPGTASDPAVRHVLVDHQGSDGEEESVGAEVRKVIDLVAEHARQRPNESLGVITMGISHARRIEAGVDRLRQDGGDLAEFFSEERSEKFFVKNLERVQGDERDAIILSVGYGKDRAGRLPYRFGPLLQEGGERRLNVAVTRARQRLTLVSSFSHLDMAPERSTKRGVQLLRAYLEYAASEGRNLGRDGVAGGPLNPFEQQVFDALVSRGLALLPQYGSSVFRIDMVARHPDRPGRLVLAIECDGATYHSAPTARDRDRLRQEHLEALGWRFHRIWSTDWFLRPEQEIERAVSAYRAAVEHADRVDRGESLLGPTPATTLRMPEAAPLPPQHPRPQVHPGLDIDEYSILSLRDLAVWMVENHPGATDTDLLTLLMRDLGFRRRGAKIRETLERAIRLARERGPRQGPRT